MSAHADSSLTPFYAGWDRYNRLLVEAVAPLTPDHLALRVAPGLRPVVELAGHIISARAWWFHGIMGEGDADIEEYYTWDKDDAPALNAAKLEIGLEATWRLVADCLARWAPADLDATFTTRRGERTRQWVIWHVIEHDIHHGGELSLTLGAHGVDAPDL
jgi:uncharacterized damage-inducible protein DinB